MAHLPLDVRALNVDFMDFSSRKMLGPNGVGVLYVRRDHFAKLGLGNVGGGMVAMHADRFEAREAPFRYEAGTPNIEGVIGLGAAVDYLRGVGMAKIAAHARALADQLMRGLAEIPNVTVLGRSAKERIAHVLHHRLHLDGTLRASAQIHNDEADIEAFVRALRDLGGTA